jgi:hypothetical protein
LKWVLLVVVWAITAQVERPEPTPTPAPDARQAITDAEQQLRELEEQLGYLKRILQATRERDGRWDE